MSGAKGEVIVREGEAFVEEAARRILEAVRETVGELRWCSLALSGGGTPVPVYEALGREEPGALPWDRMSFFFADERCVPPDHEQSNYRLVRESLFAHRDEPEGQVHRMRGEDDPEQAAALYDRALSRGVDVVVLGIGDDGHTASLFPGGPALGENERRAVAVEDAPKPPPRRITVTPPVLRGARRVFVLARGDQKAGAVARALAEEGSVEETPARLVRGGTWILDAAAASARPAPDDS